MNNHFIVYILYIGNKVEVEMNKCIKVTLNKCLNIDIKEAKKIIRDMQYLSCKASNMAIQMWKEHAIEMMTMKSADKSFNQKEYEKNTYGKTYANVIEGKMKGIMDICNTSNVGTLHQQLVQNQWKKLSKDILNYRASLPTFKLDTPVYIKNNSYTLDNSNGYFVSMSLYNMKGLKEINQKKGYQIDFQIDKMDNNKKSTINKIISGEYKQGSSQLSISDKGKVELIISFSFEPKAKVLDKNRILGIDLGLVNVAVMSIWDEGVQDWDWFSWKHNVIDGEELIKFRQKQFNINKKRQVSKKYSGSGRVGHGYKTRVKGINNGYVGNFADTYNHKISKYIVDFAIKNNCGIIQMEDLSGVTSNTHEKFLKDWSYYDLQKKIEYKSKENGIEFIKVNPKYTSKRCSKCGCIHEDNRNCKEDQSRFECQVCGHKENADINASKNIALPHIDEIIKNTEVMNNKIEIS